MRERTGLDPFEQRLAAGLERRVAGALDPRSPAAIADAAMRPRGIASRAGNAMGPRHYLLIGIAAVLVLPAAYLGALGLRQSAPETVPPPVPVASSDALLSPRSEDTSAGGRLPLFARRQEAPEPGLAVYAARADGTEALVRFLPDSIAPKGTWSEWGSVSADGWLVVANDGVGQPWTVTLVDLTDPSSAPWLLDQADVGGIGPRWGPTGLLAAPAARDRDSLLIADPRTRTTQLLSLAGHGLVGGGPYIVWSGDGSGIVGANERGAYEVMPLDGGAPQPVTGPVADRAGMYGPGMATLEICVPGIDGCRDGLVQRLDVGGSRTTVWRQAGPDRALAAAFGDAQGEYWISVDHDAGRQVQIVHVAGGTTNVVATVNRGGGGYVGAPTELPDGSGVLLQLEIGGTGATVLVPFDGGAATVHAGAFVGLADAASLDLASGFTGAPVPAPATGEAYTLPTVEQLIASEVALNPGRTVLGSASHDAVAGDTTVTTVAVPRTAGAGEVYLDCIGPSNVTVTSANGTVTSPCLSAGSYGGQVGVGTVTVTASGDTSWRVVIYSQ